MVILHLQSRKDACFLYETNCNAKIDDIIDDVAAIHNYILRIRASIGHLKELVKMGPLDESGERKNPVENPEVLNRAIADAEAAVSDEQIKKKVCFTPTMMAEEIARLAGAVSILYPMGLNPQDPVRKILEGEPIQGEHDSKTCQLWIIKKSLQRGKYFKDYYGTNERQKFVTKLTDANSGQPPKDMSMNQESQVHMLSMLRRKADELQRMQEDDSPWANPHNLSDQFQGVQEIRYPK